MPRLPKIGARTPHIFAFACAAAVAFSSHVFAQTWGGSSGYNDLVTELGGTPVTLYTGQTLLAAADSGWHYRKGTSEASSPVDAWRFPGFIEDSSWLTGQTPVGYGDGDDNTVLSDMFNGYMSVYLRREFDVPVGGVPARLQLRVYADDGAIVWINGIEAARLHATAGFNAFDDRASASHESEWEDIILYDAGALLNEGSNVIAVHALNRNIISSDFSIDVELLSPALRASQMEASSGTNYLPQDSQIPSPSVGDTFNGSSIYTGKTFRIQSVSSSLTYGQSSHANNVGNRMYSSNSIAPDLDLIDAYSAGLWLNNDGLRLGGSQAPRVETNFLQNHSWISSPSMSTTAAQLNEAVRRQDHAIARDGTICVVGLNNGSGTTVPPVLATCYNAISVGRTNGGHSRGGTTTDYDGAGRIKPEIVANDSATSYSTGQVSSGAALLAGVANARGMGKALRSPVMKSILMAGATKTEFSNWSRTPTQPIDTVFGAGEMNVQNSYHILVAGEQNAASTSGHYGWDDASLGAASDTVYTIDICEPVDELSVMLTWNRSIDSASWLGGGAFSETIANMSLQLHRLDGKTSELYDSSDSAVDNVEHIYLRKLPAGTYTLTVTTDVAVDFGLAWRADAGTPSEFSMSKGAAAKQVDFGFTGLAAGKSYSLESSDDCETWIPYLTFTASSDTHSHSDTSGYAAARTFYRLIWDPVN